VSQPFLPPSTGGTRTKARRRALELLFEADLRELDPLEILADRVELAEPPVRPFTSELVEGVTRHAAEIDAVISDCLTPGWTLDRMARVDRNLARLAVYELRYTDTPGEIIVDEAVSLGHEMSTDESPAFLNGLLGKALALPRSE